MKTLLSFTLSLLIIAMISSCGSSKKMAAVNYADLSGEWEVIEMNGKTLVPGETGQFIEFDTAQNRVSGNSGCNRFTGGVEYNAARPQVIRFTQMASTRMACLDNNKMEWENEFLKTIDGVARFASLTPQPVPTIALYGLNDARLFVLRKK